MKNRNETLYIMKRNKMSVVFDLKKLDNDISNKIAKILTFTPKNNLQKFQHNWLL